MKIKLTDLMSLADVGVKSATVRFTDKHKLVYYNPDTKKIYITTGDDAKELIEKRIKINIEK